MRRIQVCCSLFWLLFSLFVCYEALRLKLGAINNPGPGFFPFGAGLVMIGLSIAAFFQAVGKSRRLETKEAAMKDSGIRWWNIVTIMGAILVYALTLETVGFLLNTFFFIFILVKVVEPQTWKTAAIAGIIAAVAADVIFRVIFMASLPVGITGF